MTSTVWSSCFDFFHSSCWFGSVNDSVVVHFFALVLFVSFSWASWRWWMDGLSRGWTSCARERQVRSRAWCPTICFVFFMHGRCFIGAISLCCHTSTQHRVVVTYDHYSFLVAISLFFFPVGLFFRVGIHRKSLVGRWCMLLCLFDVLFDDFYSLVIRFAPGPGVLLSLSFSSCTEDVLSAAISLCCCTGTQHRVVLTCDHHSFLLPISLIFSCETSLSRRYSS